MILIHVIETLFLPVNVSGVSEFGRQLIFIPTIPIIVAVGAALLTLRWRFFTRIAPPGLHKGDGETLDRSEWSKQLTLRPFVGAAAFGWALLPLLVYINWFVWV